MVESSSSAQVTDIMSIEGNSVTIRVESTG